LSDPSLLPPDPKLVHNERLKLSASMLNALAVATIVVGGLTPIVAATFGMMSGPGPGASFLMVASLGSLLLGGGLHWCARVLLGDLK